MKNHCFFKMFLLAAFFILSNGIIVKAQFINGNLVVLKVGNGTDTLVNAGNACFFQEYNSAGTLINTIALPTTGSNPVCVSGSASSEGQITRSSDGSLICLAGYKVTPPSASSLANSTSATINRVVVKVNSAGTVTTAATTATAFSANNIRSAVSDGNNNYWAAGGTTGVYHFGIIDDTTLVSATSVNIRYIAIFNAQLYYITNKGTFGLYKVGTGLPTASGQTSTNIIATGSSSSPFAFSMNASSDTVFIADDRATTAGGGIQKWIKTAGNWALAYTLGTGTSSTVGCRSMCVKWNAVHPIIYATTAENSNNRLICIVDSNSTATAVTMATSPLNTIFRGVDFAPVNIPSPVTIPSYTISQVKGVNTQGIADSANVYCKLTGVVHGINYTNLGLSFYMMDGNAGINIYSPLSTYAYTVTEGDNIRVIGRIQQSRGLIEILPDSIVKLSAGNTLNTPLIVNSLSETNESMLIKMDSLVYVSGWPVIAGPTATVTALKGIDTIIIKIFTQCSLQGTPAPTIPFKITGIESQYTASATPPFINGYMIFPRYLSDLFTTAVNENTSLQSGYSIYPNPSNGKFEVLTTTKNTVDISIYTLYGSLIYHAAQVKAKASIDISQYAKGVYLIKIADKVSNLSYSSQLIIQ
ncbi:MAG: T9SS type A sorting domain-containing protein [Bacteroidetes bacterium]|nr:T9SS type A sorting domain-containing protein [Bacteroidota bacterium]